MFGLDKYQYSTDKTFMAYHFISNEPNGAIQKIAKFNLIREDLYNFGFGDLDAVTGDISDIAISDNKDVDVIMGTVGLIIKTRYLPEQVRPQWLDQTILPYGTIILFFYCIFKFRPLI